MLSWLLLSVDIVIVKLCFLLLSIVEVGICILLKIICWVGCVC